MRTVKQLVEKVQEAVLPVVIQIPGIGKGIIKVQDDSRPHLPSLGHLALYNDSEREHRRSTHVVAKYWFNALIVLLTGLSALMLGWETDHSVGGGSMQDRMLYFFLQFLFAVSFLIEMLLRQHQLGWDYFLNPWNMFDYTLVVMNFSDLLLSMAAQDTGPNVAATLRVIRMLRVAKYVEGIQLFRGMWLLLQGLVNSLKTMVWTGLLMLILVYTVSIILLTLISDDMESVREHWADSDKYVGSLFGTFITTVQVFTLDSWASDIARPFLVHGYPIPAALCIGTVVLCNFGVLNIIIALMVEKISEMQLGVEARNRRILEWVEQRVYNSLSDDFARSMQMKHEGKLDYKDFSEILTRQDVEYKFRLLGISHDEADSMFELMDITKSGAISADEFCEGLKRIRGPAKGLDIVALISFAYKQESAARELWRKTQRMNIRADAMQCRLDIIEAAMHEELGLRSNLEQRDTKVKSEAHARVRLLHKWDAAQDIYFPELHEEESDSDADDLDALLS